MRTNQTCAFRLLLGCLLLGGGVLVSFAKGYETPPAFMTLYANFTGPEQTSIGKTLNRAIAEDVPRTLILFTGSEVNIYDAKRKRLAGATLRTKPNSGFFEVTAVSHIGPALSYLLTLKNMKQAVWRDRAEGLLDSVKSAKQANAGPWLSQLHAPAWAGHELAIQRMLGYGLNLSEHYLESILAGAPFTIESLEDDYFKSHSEEFPIGFNNVMVGTFMLAGLEGGYRLHEVFSKASIDWSHAMVVMQFMAGKNVTAALTARTNWLHTFLVNESNGALPEASIIYPAYADRRASIGADSLPQEDYDYYVAIWNRSYIRQTYVPKIFSNIAAIKSPYLGALPGDYDTTKATDIEAFTRRIRYSFENPTEMLSNSVGFWIAGEVFDKNWDLAKLDIPGLTTGFPKGLTSY